MSEPIDQKIVNDKLRHWHFWFLVVFSLLLIITFTYYLPVRFLHEAGQTQDNHAHAVPIYQEAYDIQQGLSVDLSTNPSSVRVGEEVNLDFFVNKKPGEIPVPPHDLDIVHAKTMHVLIVRSDMNEFSHVHPVLSATPGVLTVKYIFQKPGRYKVWADITQGGINYIFGQRELLVEGEGELENKQVSFESTATVGEYRIVLETNGQAVAGLSMGLAFTIYDVEGQKIKVENYLEAPMHLAIIRDDWRQFIHAHPLESMMNGMEGMEHMMDGAMSSHEHSFLPFINRVYADAGQPHSSSAAPPSGDIAFSVTFPEVGLYKLYAQFRPQGIDLPADEALMAPFWLEVAPGTSAPTVPVASQGVPSPQTAPVGSFDGGHYHPPGTAPHVDSPVQTTTFTSIGIDSWWVLLIVSLILIVVLSKYVKKYIGEDA